MAGRDTTQGIAALFTKTLGEVTAADLGKKPESQCIPCRGGGAFDRI